MSDDNDDLDQLARLFGAKPETPPEGLLPPVEPRPTEAWPTTSVASPAPGSASDPLGWLLSDGPAAADEWAPLLPDFPAAAFATAPAPVEATQALPTRRSLAAEAARASRDTHRRNLIILGSIGAVVLILIVVLIIVLVSKSGSSGSPDAISRHTSPPSQSSSSTPSATATPTATPSATPTPTPTPTQVHTVAPPAPSPPTVPP